jgi:hypothetical protein
MARQALGTMRRATRRIHDPMSYLGIHLFGQSLEGLEATKG